MFWKRFYPLSLGCLVTGCVALFQNLVIVLEENTSLQVNTTMTVWPCLGTVQGLCCSVTCLQGFSAFSFNVSALAMNISVTDTFERKSAMNALSAKIIGYILPVQVLVI